MECEKVKLTCLTEEEWQQLSESVQEKLMVHQQELQKELETASSTAQLQLVDAEQCYFDLEKRYTTTKSQLEIESVECAKVKCKVEALEAQCNKAEEKVQKLVSSENENLSTQMRLVRSNGALESEKRELLELLEKKNRENDRLNKEWKEMSEKLTSANTSKCEALVKLEELSYQEVNVQFREKRMEQEKALVDQEVSWLKTECSKKEKEVIELRQDTTAKLMQLQTQLQAKAEEVATLQEMVDSLKLTDTEREQKLQELIDKLKDAHDSHIKQEEQFHTELLAQQKLAGLYKNSAEEAESKVQELTTAVQELQKLLKQATAAHAQLEEKYEQDLQKLQTSLAESEEKIKNFEKELENANDLISAARQRGALPMSSDQLEEMMPIAASTSKLLKSGMTLTQIYNEYVQATEALEMERIDNKRLNQYLEQILQEIEEKAPIVKKQREDYENSLKTITSMTKHHEVVMQEFDQLRLKADDCKRRSGQLERENKGLKQQCTDLGQQVRMLLKEVEEARGGHVFLASEESAVSDTEISSSSQVITDRLVNFRNIEELQEQNQHLLAVVRELSEKQETEEKQSADDHTKELQKQLETAMLDLEELRAARQRQAEMVESIVRQRDMYRVLCADAGKLQAEESMVTSTPNQPSRDKELADTKQALQQLKHEFDVYKVGKAENTSLLMTDQDKLRGSLSNLQIQNSQLVAQLEFAQERYKILQSNVESYKKEISVLRERNVKFTGNVMAYQENISTLTQEVTKVQERLARAEADTQNLRAERDLLKSVEMRLTQEREARNKEKRGQNILVANLQTIQNSLERSEHETKWRLTTQVENLERECNALRHKYEGEIEHSRTVVKGWESQVSELRSQLETELGCHQKTREELSASSQQIEQLKKEQCELQAKLVSVENRLASMKKPAETVQYKSGMQKELEDCKAQLAVAEQECKGLQVQLVHAKSSVDQYRLIAETIEQSLKEQNEASKSLQTMCESRLDEAKRTSEELERQVAALQKERDYVSQENVRLIEEKTTQSSELRKQLSTLQNELQEALAQHMDAIANEAAAHKDMEVQANVAADAQQKYEHELMLHAADVQKMSIVKEQLQDITSRLSVAEEQAKKTEEVLKSKELSWKQQEDILRSENQQLHTQCQDLEQHNSVLHEQMETMSNQMLALQSQDGEKSMSDSLNTSLGDDSLKSSEQLLEIVRFLRKGKDIAATKYEVAQAEVIRQKIRVDHLEKRVQEFQLSLNEERKKNQVGLKTATAHATLMDKVEHLNVLMDSNKLLREEKERLELQGQEQQAKVTQLETDLTSVQKELLVTKTQFGSIQAENTALKNEVQRWEARTNQLLERTSQSDPEECKKLLEEKEKQRKQFQNLLQEQNLNHKKDREQLVAQVTSLTGEVQKQKAEISKLQAGVSSAENQLQASKTEISKQNQEIINKQNQEMDNLKKQLVLSKSHLTRQNQELENMSRELAEKDQKLQHDSKHLNQVRKIGRKYKTQFDELKAQYDALEARSKSDEGDEHQARIESLESQVNELKSQISILEDENKTQTDQNQSLMEENSQLRKSEEQAKAQLNETDRIRKVLHQAKNKITQVC